MEQCSRVGRESFQLANANGIADNMKRHQADAIGEKAIEYLAASPELLNGFLNLSGMSPEEMLAVAQDTAIRVNALHFIAGEESNAKAFSESVGLKPGQLTQALSILDPHGSSAW